MLKSALKGGKKQAEVVKRGRGRSPKPKPPAEIQLVEGSPDVTGRKNIVTEDNVLLEARTAMRRARVFEMAVAGLSPRVIASTLSKETGNLVRPKQVYDDIQAELAALRATIADQAEVMRVLELERLDQMTASLYPDCITRRIPCEPSHAHPDGWKIVKPDHSSIRSYLAVADRRAKLIGYDAPTKSVQFVIPWDQLEKRPDLMARIAEGEDVEEVVMSAKLLTAGEIVEGEIVSE